MKRPGNALCKRGLEDHYYPSPLDQTASSSCGTGEEWEKRFFIVQGGSALFFFLHLSRSPRMMT